MSNKILKSELQRRVQLARHLLIQKHQEIESYAELKRQLLYLTEKLEKLGISEETLNSLKKGIKKKNERKRNPTRRGWLGHL